jgi:Beta-lactamase class A
VASAIATPSPTPEALVFANAGSSGAWLVDEPLADLSPAAALAAELDGGIGVAVLVPSQGVIYELNGDAQYELASVAKLPIMLTLLDQTVSEGRQLTDDEQYELTQMITLSDNDAADWLWNDVGGAEPVTEFLQTVGIDDAVIDPSDWGSSTLSSMDAATLMADLVGGMILDAPSRELAMSLLSTVDPSQAWGAVVAAPAGADTGVKNGWYPEDAGWVLDSTGFVQGAGSGSDYTIAIFTYSQADFYAGIDTIQQIGQEIYQAMAVRGGSPVAGAATLG